MKNKKFRIKKLNFLLYTVLLLAIIIPFAFASRIIDFEQIQFDSELSTNSSTLSLYTQNTSRLYITNEGLIGIGTITPDSPLTVVGNEITTNAILHLNASDNYNTSVTNVITLDHVLKNPVNSTGGVGVSILFRATDNASQLENIGNISGILYNSTNGSELSALTFSTRGADTESGGGHLIERLRIDGNGNVGIGTATPNATLDVQDVVTLHKGGSGQGHLQFRDSGTINIDSDNNFATNTLIFKADAHENTGGTDIMTLESGGNVGIGTTGPTTTLHLNSTASTELRMDRDSKSSDSGINFYTQGTQEWFIGTGVSALLDSSLYFYDGVSLATRLFIENTTGNVGIGTTSPSSKLDVRSGNITIYDISDDRPTLRFVDSGGSERGTIWIGNGPAEDEDSLYIQGGGEEYIYFKDSDETFMVVGGADGNVGIGTISPAQKLEVAGIILVNDTSTSNKIQMNSPSSTYDTLLSFTETGDAQLDYQIYHSGLSNIFELWSSDIDGAGGNGAIFTIADGSNDVKFSGGISTDGNSAPTSGIITSGNVGIGTTSPGALLHVARSSGFPAANFSGTSNQIRITDTTDGTNYDLDVDSENFNIADVEGGANRLTIGPSGNVTIDSTTLFVDADANNVGIGTAGPVNKVHIEGTDNYIRFTDSADTGTTASDGSRIGLNGFQLFIDNQESSDIVFRTTASERMRIDQSGNVGIGTTTPSATLELQRADNGVDIWINNSGTRGPQIAFFKGTNPNQIGMIGAVGKWLGNSDSNFGIMADGKGNISFFAGGSASEHMRIDSSGSVGIGTTAPGAALHVNSTSNPQFRVDGASDRGGMIWLNSTGNQKVRFGFGPYIYTANTPNDVGLGSEDTGKLNFGTAGDNVRMTIDESGNVGIGTTAPGQKLHVIGSANVSSSMDIGSPATTGTVLDIGDSSTGSERLRVANSEGYADFGTDNGEGQIWVGGSGPHITIDSGGNVGIGDTTPTEAKLVIGSAGAGDVYLTLATSGTTNDAVCWDNSGATLLYDCDSTPADIAEYYESSYDVTPGDLVAFHKNDKDTTKYILKKATSSDQSIVAGIISTNPYQRFGEDVFLVAENPMLLSLVGRVPVKINLEGGPIDVGDLLTLSSIPGEAKKLNSGESGIVIGRALEDFDSTKEINDLIGNQIGLKKAEELRVKAKGQLDEEYKRIAGFKAGMTNEDIDVFYEFLMRELNAGNKAPLAEELPNVLDENKAFEDIKLDENTSNSDKIQELPQKIIALKEKFEITNEDIIKIDVKELNVSFNIIHGVRQYANKLREEAALLESANTPRVLAFLNPSLFAQTTMAPQALQAAKTDVNIFYSGNELKQATINAANDTAVTTSEYLAKDFSFRAGAKGNFSELMSINALTGEVKVKKLTAELLEVKDLVSNNSIPSDIGITKVNGSVIIRLG
jgi:hypothetical protein